MATDDNSGAKPAGPVVLRIKLRYENIDAMVQRFAPNVGKSGLFLPTKSIQPIGTEVKFELRLANDTPALVGIGRVKHVKKPDPANPKAAFGMAIELMRVSREGREVIIRMIERRRAMGLADVAIPILEDTETARRAEVETQPRADTSGIVRDSMQQFASAPVAEAILPVSAPASTPIAIAKEPSRPSAAPLMTSARDSGPISREASKSVPMLAPEAPRAKRPRVADLIAKANELSGPLTSVHVPGLDEHVDVEAALARARALAAGMDLEAELAGLRDASAAPVEISIDAASAELARQLGGVAISKRDRSARWAPPPAVETRPEPKPESVETNAEQFVEKTRAETEASAAAVIASVIDKAVEAAPPPDPAPIEEPADHESAGYQRDDDDAFAQSASTTTAIDPAQAAQSNLLIDDNADPSSFERAFSDAERLNTGDLEAIDEDDLESHGERTQIGSMPVDPQAFASHAYATAPDPSLEQADQLGHQIDRHLDEAEAEADAEVSQGFQAEYPYAHEAPQQYAGNDEEVSDGDVLAEADEGDADLMQRRPSVHEIAPADSLAAVQLPEEEQLPPPDEFDPEAAAEFDRESAREFDRDLQRTSSQHYAQPDPYAQPQPDPYAQAQELADRPSVSDFAARLDLGDDDLPEEPVAPPPVAYPRHRRASSEFPDPPSSSYTFAEQFPDAGLPPHGSTLDRVLAEAEGEEFDEPHSYARSHQATRPPAGDDLEDALSALDVDLDGGARPPERPSSPSQSRPLPGLPIHRPTTGPVPIVPKPTPTGPVRTVAHTVKRPPTRPTKPPPPPAAAFRKTPTQQVPVTPTPKPRAPTDDGIVIDFDEDE